MKPIDRDERAVFGALDRDECLTLLRWESVGRLAVARAGSAPIVVPVNFVLDGESILFRTDLGDTVDRLLENPASFQVDRFDWFRRTGWSVLVQGEARLLTPAEIPDLDLRPWAPGMKDLVVRLLIETVSGRRIELLPGADEPGGYL